MGSKGYEELNQESLQNAIDSQFGAGKVNVVDNGNDTFTVSFIGTKREYNISKKDVGIIIDWNEAMRNAKAPDNQKSTSKNVIGIGTDGEPVNMDLWSYYLLDDDTYTLNSQESYNGTQDECGYKGNIINGTIEGTIPQFISTDGGKKYKKVTSLYETFMSLSDLKNIKTIPSTITEMKWTFWNCTNLQVAPSIPSNVVDMSGTFFKCIMLEKTPLLPLSVKNMYRSFDRCINLKIITNIPEKVENLKFTFYGCSNLEDINLIIPNSVKNMNRTFYECTNLWGTIVINATLSGEMVGNELDYEWCFYRSALGEQKLTIYGSCNFLDKLYESKTENSNIVLLK